MRKIADPPKARTADLIVKELPEEVLIYDLKRDRAHCLNLTAAAVWKYCDGQTSPAEIARRLARTLGSDVVTDSTSASPGLNEQLVWLALEQLSRDHLLAQPLSGPVTIQHMSRREAIRRVGLSAAIALPLIVSITAPMPAQAGTCKVRNANCSTGAECCSKACVASKCA